jgi:hypothetical protein
MRRTFYIPALVLFYLLTTAKSCDRQEQDDDSRDQARIKSAQDSLRSTFASDTLPGASLRAFEATAKIRLADFSDYLSILADTSVDAAFRNKAREMILALFISENSVLWLTGPGNQGRREVSVKQVLASAEEGAAMLGKIMPGSIVAQNPLQRAGDSIYTGQLSFSYIPSGHDPEKTPEQKPAGGTLNFLLAKHKKAFGKDTLMVWEVFLGEL